MNYAAASAEATASSRWLISAMSIEGRSIQARSSRLPIGVSVQSSARKSVIRLRRAGKERFNQLKVAHGDGVEDQAVLALVIADAVHMVERSALRLVCARSAEWLRQRRLRRCGPQGRSLRARARRNDFPPAEWRSPAQNIQSSSGVSLQRANGASSVDAIRGAVSHPRAAATAAKLGCAEDSNSGSDAAKSNSRGRRVCNSSASAARRRRDP